MRMLALGLVGSYCFRCANPKRPFHTSVKFIDSECNSKYSCIGFKYAVAFPSGFTTWDTNTPFFEVWAVFGK